MLFIIKRNAAIKAACFAALAGLALSGSVLYLKIDLEVLTDWAVVTKGPAEIRNGPGLSDTVAFNLPEGRKVKVLSENGSWAAVELPVEGLTGWIEKDYIGHISSTDGGI